MISSTVTVEEVEKKIIDMILEGDKHVRLLEFVMPKQKY